MCHLATLTANKKEIIQGMHYFRIQQCAVIRKTNSKQNNKNGSTPMGFHERHANNTSLIRMNKKN